MVARGKLPTLQQPTYGSNCATTSVYTRKIMCNTAVMQYLYPGKISLLIHTVTTIYYIIYTMGSGYQ